MSDIADRYRRLADRFTTVVGAVPDHSWTAPSPCQGWTARHVLDHVVDSEEQFLRRFDLAAVTDHADPLVRWQQVRDAMQAALDDPAAAGTSYDGYFGPTTLEDTVDGFHAPDLVVHAWDIARAAGLPDLEPMPADEVERLDARFRQLGDVVRAPEVFGPEVPVPEGASPQDRLLGFLGRQP
jgi:uncharacterized protein (TIGR03086 family)